MPTIEGCKGQLQRLRQSEVQRVIAFQVIFPRQIDDAVRGNDLKMNSSVETLKIPEGLMKLHARQYLAPLLPELRLPPRREPRPCVPLHTHPSSSGKIRRCCVDWLNPRPPRRKRSFNWLLYETEVVAPTGIRTPGYRRERVDVPQLLVGHSWAIQGQISAKAHEQSPPLTSPNALIYRLWASVSCCGKRGDTRLLIRRSQVRALVGEPRSHKGLARARPYFLSPP